MNTHWRNEFYIRDWQEGDRLPAAGVVKSVLAEYGLSWAPNGSDKELLEVEKYYEQTGGAFWVVEAAGEIVGTAGYVPTQRGTKAVEARKLFLLPRVRGQGLGKHLMKELEQSIAQRGFHQIWVETASVLKEAVKLYENLGYTLTTGAETSRCDLVYIKTLNAATTMENKA